MHLAVTYRKADCEINKEKMWESNVEKKCSMQAGAPRAPAHDHLTLCFSSSSPSGLIGNLSQVAAPVQAAVGELVETLKRAGQQTSFRSSVLFFLDGDGILSAVGLQQAHYVRVALLLGPKKRCVPMLQRAGVSAAHALDHSVRAARAVCAGLTSDTCRGRKGSR